MRSMIRGSGLKGGRRLIGVLAVTASLAGTAQGRAGAEQATGPEGEPSAAAQATDASGTVYVTEYDTKDVVAITPDKAVTVLAHLEGDPYGAAVSPDGTTVYVTQNIGGPWSGSVVAIPTAGGAVRTVKDGMWWPYGITISADGRTLYVAEDGFDGDIAAVPAVGGEATRVVEHVMYPKHVSVDAGYLYYSNGTQQVVDGEIRRVNLVDGTSGLLMNRRSNGIALFGNQLESIFAGQLWASPNGHTCGSFSDELCRIQARDDLLKGATDLAVHGDTAYIGTGDGKVVKTTSLRQDSVDTALFADVHHTVYGLAVHL